jgi:hypothetical protein
MFDAQEALGELRRFGLLKEKCLVPISSSSGRGITSSSSSSGGGGGGSSSSSSGRGGGVGSSSSSSGRGGTSGLGLSVGSLQQQQQQQQAAGLGEARGSEVVVLYSVVGCRAAQRLLEQHWADLLQRRVGTILQGLPSE